MWVRWCLCVGACWVLFPSEGRGICEIVLCRTIILLRHVESADCGGACGGGFFNWRKNVELQSYMFVR